MTYQSDCTLPDELLAQIANEGLDCLPELIRVMMALCAGFAINTAMQIERQHHIGVAPYERSDERKAHANGYKPKRVTTRVGEVRFAVPQVREGDFYPQALEKGLRSERALTLALAEMYVQGVSTRKVAKSTEKLCGSSVSSTQVSQAAAPLDSILEAWRNRPLGVCIYLYLDARYEKVRLAPRGHPQVREAAVLIASAVNVDGKRQILGVSVSLSEQEVHWRAFLQSLVTRGLCGLHLIISDAHPGLKQARQAVFGSIPWQRCQFHLQQNAQAYVPRKDMKTEVAADIRAIYNAPNRIEADALLAKTVQRYATRYPKLAEWLETNLPDGLTVFDFPEAHRRLIRTTNGLERLNKEIKRRTRVVGIFPNENACLRLVTAIAMEYSDEWETGKAYILLTPSC